MTARTARRLPVHRGAAAWSAILPGQEPPRVLKCDEKADFAIVGAGFAGLSAARRLKELNPTARIVVIDAGRIAEGASGRNSGFMIDLPHDLSSEDYAGQGVDDDKKMIALNRAAIAFANTAVDDYRIDPAFFDTCGKVNGAASAAADVHNRTYAAHLAEIGERSELLDAHAMYELTGSRHYVSGLYTPGTVMLQPAGYIRGLAAGLRHEGVAVYENSPVHRIVRTLSEWTLHHGQGRITASKAILANNGHLESFGFAERLLMHVFLYASMTVDLGAEALTKLGGRPRWGITPSDPMGTTMRRIDVAQGGNRIVTRSCASYRTDMQVSAAAVRHAAHVHRRKFDDRFPALKDVKMEYSWAGHLCLSRNGVSVVRELEPGLFSACVDNGLGTTRGTLAGIAAAELASGGVSSAETRHFSAEPEPKRLPPSPIAELGANAYLRWREWRAAKE